MKTYETRPSFEFIFELSLLVIMVLPLLVFAQGVKKEMDIRIINGDTTINGRNIKDLQPEERKQALKDIDNLGSVFNSGRGHLVLSKRAWTDTGGNKLMIERHGFYGDGKDDVMTAMPGMTKDSTKHIFKSRMKGLNSLDSTFTFNYRRNDDFGYRVEGRESDPGSRKRDLWMDNFDHRNVQRFEFINTGSDGMSTHRAYRVSDVSPEKLKSRTGREKAELELKDLNIVPEFSSGKTLLMFTLIIKTAAEVKLTDNNGKLIWGDKAINGKFSKAFPLGLNGIYYLEVKQAGKAALKRIIKEE